MISPTRTSAIPRAGETFSAHRMFYASMVPDSVMSLPSLREGSKLLLARLYRFAGHRDRCNPSLPRLAAELGTSDDKIGKWLKELEKHGFIRTVRHARREAERLLLWHPELAGSLRTATHSNHGSTQQRNQNRSDETAAMRNHESSMIPQNRDDDSAKTPPMIPQKRDPYKEKRIMEENHHRSEISATTQEPARPTGDSDDDSIFSFKVKTLLQEFFTSRGLQTPRGQNPAPAITETLRRQGRDAVEGIAEFLRSYGDNLRSAPATWTHVIVSFEAWAHRSPCLGNVVGIRKESPSQRNALPTRSRYPLASLPDPFATAPRAAAL